MLGREGDPGKPAVRSRPLTAGMKKELVSTSANSLARFGFDKLPRVITNAGERASRRFVEFFTANIRNKNTRLAYAQAVGRSPATSSSPNVGSRSTCRNTERLCRRIRSWCATNSSVRTPAPSRSRR